MICTVAMLGMVAIAPKVGRPSRHCWRRRLRGAGAEVNCKTPFGWFSAGGSSRYDDVADTRWPDWVRTECLRAPIVPRNNRSHCRRKFSISRRDAPELCVGCRPPKRTRGRRESRMRAAPAVSCANENKKTHTSIQVKRRQSGFPCAAVYGLFRALLGDRAFLPPSFPRTCFSRTWRQRRGVGTTRLRRPHRLAFVLRKPSRPLHPTARSWRSRAAPLIG